MLLCCITLSSSREKPTQCSRGSKKDFWRRCRGVYAQVKTYQVPITNSYPSHYIICHLPLVFLSPTSPLPFYSPFFPVCLSFAMAESKRSKGSLHGFNNLDSPSVLSKLINNDAMEGSTGVVKENLNHCDEDDLGIFHYLLDESLKDAWDRLLRIRASYVPQYQIEIYLIFL